MTLRKHVPNPDDPRHRRRILTALSVAMFAFEVTGALAVAVGVVALVAIHAGVYAAVTVAGVFVFAYAAAGQFLIQETLNL